jgi:hypothetical protein
MDISDLLDINYLNKLSFRLFAYSPPPLLGNFHSSMCTYSMSCATLLTAHRAAHVHLLYVVRPAARTAHLTTRPAARTRLLCALLLHTLLTTLHAQPLAPPPLCVLCCAPASFMHVASHVAAAHVRVLCAYLATTCRTPCPARQPLSSSQACCRRWLKKR